MEKPGVLLSLGLQRVRCDLVTEQQLCCVELECPQGMRMGVSRSESPVSTEMSLFSAVTSH